MKLYQYWLLFIIYLKVCDSNTVLLSLIFTTNTQKSSDCGYYSDNACWACTAKQLYYSHAENGLRLSPSDFPAQGSPLMQWNYNFLYCIICYIDSIRYCTQGSFFYFFIPPRKERRHIKKAEVGKEERNVHGFCEWQNIIKTT